MLTIPSEIRNLLKSDSVNKNFRVHFPNGERADITNENIVDDSITFGESICSSEQLQFGLCETPTLEFETVGVENIKGTVIECSMEVIVPESLSSVTGVSYKSDINKWVYSLPYGTFIVDSCKKQSDMTHRRITTYNTFGYKNWEFNSSIQKALTYKFYWNAKNLKLSIESLVKLLMPEFNANYQLESPEYVNARSATRIITEGGVEYQYKLDYYYGCYNWNRIGQNGISGEFYPIKNYRVKYSSEYTQIAKKILDIYDKGDRLIIYNLIPAFYSPNLNYYHYNNSKQEFDYKYVLPDFDGAFDLPNDIRSYITNSGTYTYTDLTQYTSELTPSSLWIYRGLLNNVILSAFDDCGINIFHRLRLSRRIYESSEDFAIIYDTGETAPNVYFDQNAKNIKLFNSPSGIYIPLEYKQKTKSMTKYTYSSGSESTISQTLYEYDLSKLLALDNKEIIQSYIELQGKFGLVKRDGSIDFISVNEAFNTPDETIPKSEYETIWYDDYMSKPYGRISATYTNENNENTYTYLDIVEDFSEEKYKTYDISNNFFIKNYSRTEEDIQLIFTAMSLNMKDISFMPMQITMKGRPDLEAGDVILIESDDQEEPIVGFMMQRRLTGVNSLRDEISSQDEISSETASSLKATYDEDTGTLTLYTADTRR